ncbi:MAG: hypothetical protein AMXMBFR61_19750 [Fimbriimonadales bacterium]
MDDHPGNGCEVRKREGENANQEADAESVHLFTPERAAGHTCPNMQPSSGGWVPPLRSRPNPWECGNRQAFFSVVTGKLVVLRGSHERPFGM